MTRQILNPLIAFGIPVLLALLGITKALGAHIWWDVTTILIGAPIGLLVSFLIAQKWDAYVKRMILWLILLALAFTAAKYGQTAFAASYGDDAMAGTFWYFGWIATGGCAAGLIYSLLKR